MSPIEAFRVAVISDVRTTPLPEISRAWDCARSLLVKLLEPVNLGARLQFNADQDALGRSWLIVSVAPPRGDLLAGLDGDRDLMLVGEVEKVRKALQNYLSQIKATMRQWQLSGYQLEQLGARFAELAAFSAAFGITMVDEKRALVEYCNVSTDEFVLSQLPGRFVSSTAVKVRLLIEKIGRASAQVCLARPCKTALGVKRRRQLLSWDRDAVGDAAWSALVERTRTETFVEMEVKIVYNVKGRGVELLLVGIDPASLTGATARVPVPPARAATQRLVPDRANVLAGLPPGEPQVRGMQ